MFGSWKVSSFVSSFSYWLRKTWHAWDVRVLVLLSLLFQIALFVLGKRRKHSVRSFNRMILWFTYITADWVAIAALGKLSNSHTESPTTNVLRALWAPLLILHLGGPDTITAYSFEDNQLWNRHILTLILRSFFAVYVISLSWTHSWLSFLNLPLIFAGILKYVERILCLERTSSKRTDPIISIFNDPEKLTAPEAASFLHIFLTDKPDSKIVLLAYFLFSVMRPDANDYLCNKLYLKSTKVRTQTYLEKNTSGFTEFVKIILGELFEMEEKSEAHFEIASANLGFIFDVVYTKAGLIYTKKGCFLRLCSFTCSFLVLLLFLISIVNKPMFHFSSVDIYITVSLLGAAVALELWAMYSMVSSNWAVPLVLFHDNPLVRKILRFILQYIHFSFPQRKKWSGEKMERKEKKSSGKMVKKNRKKWFGKMGQFNLVDYCWNTRDAKVYAFLEKNFRSPILAERHRFSYTNFEEVPGCLKLREDYQSLLDSFFKHDSFEPTRGEKTLGDFRKPLEGSPLEQSIKLDFDASIIVWHLATSICYHQDVQHSYRNVLIEDRKSSKYLSNYMMYLLAIQPAMLLPAHSTSFWLDACCGSLKELFSKASNMDHAFTLLLKDDDREAQSNIRNPMNELKRYASNLVMELNLEQVWGRWKMIKTIWIEMLLYAAHSCQHINHVKQLGLYDREFLTLIWIMGGSHFVREIVNEEE